MYKYTSKHGSSVEINQGHASLKLSKKEWQAIGKQAGWADGPKVNNLLDMIGKLSPREQTDLLERAKDQFKNKNPVGPTPTNRPGAHPLPGSTSAKPVPAKPVPNPLPLPNDLGDDLGLPDTAKTVLPNDHALADDLGLDNLELPDFADMPDNNLSNPSGNYTIDDSRDADQDADDDEWNKQFGQRMKPRKDVQLGSEHL